MTLEKKAIWECDECGYESDSEMIMCPVCDGCTECCHCNDEDGDE